MPTSAGTVCPGLPRPVRFSALPPLGPAAVPVDVSADAPGGALAPVAASADPPPVPERPPGTPVARCRRLVSCCTDALSASCRSAAHRLLTGGRPFATAMARCECAPLARSACLTARRASAAASAILQTKGAVVMQSKSPTPDSAETQDPISQTVCRMQRSPSDRPAPGVEAAS